MLLRYAAAFLAFSCAATAAAQAAGTIKIERAESAPTISRHIYGHFAEHLGRCIYDGFYVGSKSPVPNDQGLRTDVIAALKDIGVPNLRWPGGCFADDYHWRDGIGPVAERPKRTNIHWGGVIESNEFGTHEFLNLCEQLDCDPIICGNVGSGTVQEFREWIEYCNADGDGSIPQLRKQNGRDKPWGVRYWGVGNESWGCGGNMAPETYAALMTQFSTYARNWGGAPLYRVACGASDADYRWTEVLMGEWRRKHTFEGLSLHYYTLVGDWQRKGSATDFEEAQWFRGLQRSLVMEELLRRHDEIMNRVDPEKRCGLCVDEWGMWHDVEPGSNPGFLYQQNTLRDALVAGITLNAFNNHADRVKMANIAQTINVLQAMLLTKDDQIVKTPTYYVFKMYRGHHDAKLLPTKVEAEPYTFDNENIPAVTVSASEKDNAITLTATNADPNKSRTLRVSLGQSLDGRKVSGEVLTADKINDFNDFGAAEKVTIADFAGAKVDGDELVVELPAKSVVALQISK